MTELDKVALSSFPLSREASPQTITKLPKYGYYIIMLSEGSLRGRQRCPMPLPVCYFRFNHEDEMGDLWRGGGKESHGLRHNLR